MNAAQKKLEDFPEFCRINETVQGLQRQQGEITARIEEITLELSKPNNQRRVNGEDAWQHALEGKGEFAEFPTVEVDVTSSLREELGDLEGRGRFIGEALEVGLHELDKARGQASLRLCEQIRPKWIEHVRQILEHLKAISEANEVLNRMRADLETQGISTGSLPHSSFDLGGKWNDEFGGRLPGYQRYTSECFPELAGPAGMAIKAKLAALARKQQSFEEGRNSQ
jgi:hypothetical protein